MFDAAAPPPLNLVTVPCTTCGAEETEHLWTGREHEYPHTSDEDFHVVRCSACGLARLNPRPDVTELDRIYPPEYYAYHLVPGEGDDLEVGGGLGNRIKRWFYERGLVATLRRADLLEGDGEIRLLDIGCGDGRLLDWYKMTSVGDRLVTHGCELSEAAAEVARRRGHFVVAGRFEDTDELEPKSYHLVTSRHVIEHVADPVGFTRAAADLLVPGGTLMLATPNIDSPDVRRFRGTWGGNHFPRHWTLYDADSIARVAEECGLEVVHIEYELNPVFWNWSLHASLKKRLPNSTWPDRLFPPVSIFFPSTRSFLLLSAFTVIDLIQKVVTGRTGSMIIEMRKPA